MSDECFKLDEMDALVNLRPDDPRRRHLSTCPLCKARLAAYRAFIADGAPAAGSRPEEAAAELEAFSARITARDESAERRGFGAWLRAHRIPKPALVPGLVTAAAAIVILLAVLHPFHGIEERRPAALRGLEPAAGARPELFSLEAVIEDETVRFSWQPLVGADRYEVLVLDTRLEEAGRFDAAGEARLSADIRRLPTGGIVWWRVVAYRGGDELARSRLVTLDLDTN